MEKIYRLWLPVSVWSGLIYFLSSIPDLKTDLEYDFILRKLAHIAEYAILTFLLLRAFKHTFSLSMLDLVIYPVLIAIAYAGLDEYHQTFVAGRHGAVSDVMIDSIGILGIYAAFLFFQKLKEVIKHRVH